MVISASVRYRAISRAVVRGINGAEEFRSAALNPEQSAIAGERMGGVMRLLDSSPYRDVLARTHLLDQPQDRICADLGINGPRFRLLKSRGTAELRRRCAAGGLS